MSTSNAVTVYANANSSEKTSGSNVLLIITFGLSITCIVFFGIAFTNLSAFLGNNDKWQAIKDQLRKVLPYTLGGSLCLFAVAFVYFKNNPTYITYFIMILLCISITLAYTALYVSALE